MSALAAERRRRRGLARERVGECAAVGESAAAGERAGVGERAALAARAAEPAPTLFGDVAGGSTLSDLVAGLWEGLAAHHRVPCPLCGEPMAPVYGAHARPSHGRCRGCETTIA